MRVRSGAADDPKVRFHAMKKKDQKKEGVTLSVELRDFVFERLPSPPTLSRRPRSTTTRTPSTSFSNATLSMETRARKRKRERRDATAANPGEAIPGLLNDIVITHVLRSEYFDATASRIARLTAGSRARSTGLQFEELDDQRALHLGCFSALQRRQRQGRLSRQEYLCLAAERGGHLEELKVLRADGCPWDKWTCAWALKGGHLVVLQWLRSNGCPWDEQTCSRAALGGHLEGLQWARANGCPWDEGTCSGAAYHGHLEVLKWARANRCRWTASARAEAADLGYIESDGSDDDSLSDDSDKAETSK